MKSGSTKPALQVPILDLSRQYASLRSEVLAAIERVCDSQQYILGQETVSFERELAGLCGTREAVACASGTDALWLALVAAGVQPGDEVITTPFTFFATASAITRAGARPVFADIDPATLNIAPESVARRLEQSSGRCGALLPVHLYGQCADMDSLQQLADEFKLTIVEDAAQAIGALWKNRPAGALGAMAAFSFYPTKNLSAFGDAGALTTDSPEMADHLRRLRNHGGRERYYHDEIGANSRLDGIQAAVLRVKLPHLQEWNSARRSRAQMYDQLLTDSGLTGANRSGSDTPVMLLSTLPQCHHIYHQYVIRVQQRDQLRNFLKERGVSSEIFYPVPLHLQKCFAYLGYSAGDLPQAEKAAQEVLALPMFAELRDHEQRYVVDAIAEFYS